MSKKTHVETENHQPKSVPFYKKKFYIISAIIALLVFIIIAYAVTREEVTEISTMKAERVDLIQEVSVTGSVEPAESVNLSFEITGKVKEIFAKVGDRVETGDKLISLNSADIQAQLNQAYAGAASANALVQQYQAALDTQKAILEELKRGTRPEELQLSQTTLENTRKALTDAQTNLENVKAKAETDLRSVYETSKTALPTAVDAGKTAILSLSDIQAVFDIETSVGLLWMQSVRDYFRYMWT